MTGFDMSESIIPKSDQLNSDDLISGPRTFTVADVQAGSAEQPVNIHLVENPGRPFRPSKTVRRILVAAWGSDASVYAGRRMTLYRDPGIRFGGDVVGGIRVSHLSHIAKPLTLALTVTRGKRATTVVQPLKEQAPLPVDPSRAIAAFAGIGVEQQQLEAKVGRPAQQWAPTDLDVLEATFGAIRRGQTTAADQFPSAAQQPPAEQPDGGAPTPAETGEPLAERRHIQRLLILLRGALGDDREKRLEWVEEQIGRPIESTNELTVLEADRCIKVAEALPTRSKPVTPEEPPAEEDR